VPVRVAAEEMVWPLRVVAKRLVEEAVVAKKLVVVAEVPVAFEKVKLWRVVEPIAVRLVVEPVTKARKLVKRLPVVVALVVVERVTSLRSVKVLSPLKPLLSVRRVDEAKLPLQPVQEPTVRFPIVAELEKRIDVEALPET
jgi:hypothetical protein